MVKKNTSPKADNDIAATLATTELIETMVDRVFNGRKIKAIFRPQDSFYDSGAKIEINEPKQVVFFPDQTGISKKNSEISAVRIVLIDDERRIDFTFFLSMEWEIQEGTPSIIPARSSELSKPSTIGIITSKGELTNTVFTLDLITINTGHLPEPSGQGRGFLAFDWERY